MSAVFHGDAPVLKQDGWGQPKGEFVGTMDIA